MKITLSKSQWELIGKKAGWMNKYALIDLGDSSSGQSEWQNKLPQPNKEEIGQGWEGGEYNYAIRMAKDPSCPIEYLLQLAKHGQSDAQLLKTILKNPNASPEVIMAVKANPNYTNPNYGKY